MAINFRDRAGEKKICVGRLRRAQLVTTFGPGALNDMPDCSIILAGIEYWSKKSPRLHERNLQRLLGVKYFCEPYVSESPENVIKPDVPAFRFPYHHFCPKCGRLKPFWQFDGERNHFCGEGHAKSSIVPARFMVACVNGHLEDFPYNWWVHYGGRCSGGREDLRVEFNDETGGLDHIIIKCASCGAKRSMAGCMSSDALKNYRCRGKRPWLGLKKADEERCEALMRTVQRGASNVYFSIGASALTIPPWSSKLHQAIAANYDHFEPILDRPPKLLQAIDVYLDNLLEIYSREEIMSELKNFNASAARYTRQDLLEDEYKVFCWGDYNKDDDVQFKLARAAVPDFLNGFIDDVVLVKRLREVAALIGFRRLIPDAPDADDPRFHGYHIDGDCVPLSAEKTDWLPAIEMLGEGIFIRLNESRVLEWEEKNQARYSEMRRRLENGTLECENFSARYVLLHTLAHLLIRQISLTCGYASAALKERLYSTYPQSEKMSGVLIYTSSSDSDGSLGGLVQNGRTAMFGSLVRGMLSEASWCSSDPICIQSQAQGYNSLNYAACHACALLPETGCEMRNCLLDRRAVIDYFGAE